MRHAALFVFLTAAACAPPDWVRANAGAEVTFDAVHGTGPNDVWAVGDLGTITHFNGAAWTVVPPVTQVHLRAVAAAATNDVWVFGDSGTALHFDGKGWTRVDLGTTSTLQQALAFAPNDVWVLPKDVHHVLHWNGTAWGQVDATTKDGYGRCIGGNGPNNLWLMPTYTSKAYLLTAGGLAELSLDISGDFDCVGISAQANNDAWFLSDEKVLHFDGRLFRSSTQPAKDLLAATFYAKAIWATSPGVAWVVGSGGGVYRVQGDTWTPSVAATYGQQSLNAIWGAHVDDLWSVGLEGVVQHHAPARVVE